MTYSQNEKEGAMKKFMTLLLITTLMTGSTMQVQAKVITPYDTMADPDEFINGATFVLEDTPNYKEWLAAELKRAHDIYHINTITVYGLEGFDEAYRTCLFENLKKLNMKICVRIESYNAEVFAFTPEDADDVISRYRELVEFTCRRSG